MSVAGVDPNKLDTRSLGFALGPRMNAAGRLETAVYAQELLLTREGMVALEKAQQLDAMNAERRREQDKIFKAAMQQAEEYASDPVLVVSHADWNHGIVGIVAAKLLERYKKPSYVLQEIGEESKGSARSYGDFSAADAIRASEHLITKGGGHKLAAGVTLPTANIAAFRKNINDYFASLSLRPQAQLLLPNADATIASFDQIDEQFMQEVASMEPFGNGNPMPILKATRVLVRDSRRMGAEAQHLKIEVQDKRGKTFILVAFNADDTWRCEPGDHVSVWFQPQVNEWRGALSIEGRLLHIAFGEE